MIDRLTSPTAHPTRRELLKLIAASAGTVPAAAFAGLIPQRAGTRQSSIGGKGPARSSASGKKPAGPGFLLVDITRQAGLGGALNVCGERDTKKFLVEEMGSGAAFFDYDNDGWPDIFLVNGTRFNLTGAPPSNFLFHNNRDGTFTDVTLKAGLTRSGWGQGCCIGDYDNDGFDDLFVTYWGGSVLYHNNGDGTFTDVTAKAGLLQQGPHPRWNTGCCFLDYDRDGHLDLFVADYVNFDPAVAPAPGSSKLCTYYGIPVACGPQGWAGGTNVLYRNRGDDTFEDVSEKAGVIRPAGPPEPATVSDHWMPVGSYGMSAVAADFDNDGWPDIYVSCDEAPSLLYHNNHDGTFTEVGSAAGCALSENGSTQGGMGIGVGDYDGDGWLDIVKPNFSDENISLFRNNGNGTFYDAVFQAGLGASTKTVGWGAGFIDLDNDGWRDLFISTGHVYPEIARRHLHVAYAVPKLVFRNLGNGHFEDVSAKAGPGAVELHSSRGCAFGDFDNDGDVDVVVNNLNEPPSLLRNDVSSRGNWIKIKCLGTRSNRSAIGARVKIVAGGRSQIDEVMSGSSYVSQNDLRLHFGLGEATGVDQAEVRWPSGEVESIGRLEANRFVTIQEGKGVIRSDRLRSKP